MRPPGPVLVAAVATFIAAAMAALAADGPLPRWCRGWRFPVLVVGIALVNVGLALTVAVEPNTVEGTVLLGSAVLMVYALHRWARMARVAGPTRRRGPKR